MREKAIDRLEGFTFDIYQSTIESIACNLSKNIFKLSSSDSLSGNFLKIPKPLHPRNAIHFACTGKLAGMLTYSLQAS